MKLITERIAFGTLLLQVADFIESAPQKLHMPWFVQVDNPAVAPTVADDGTICGTAACVSGWADMAMGVHWSRASTHVAERALLGVPETDGKSELFDRVFYNNDLTDAPAREVAAAVRAWVAAYPELAAREVSPEDVADYARPHTW